MIRTRNEEEGDIYERTEEGTKGAKLKLERYIAFVGRKRHMYFESLPSEQSTSTPFLMGRGGVVSVRERCPRWC